MLLLPSSITPKRVLSRLNLQEKTGRREEEQESDREAVFEG